MQREKLIPLGPRILVQVDAPSEITKSKIHILEQTKDRESASVETGTVLAIGHVAFDGFGDGSPWVKKGDRVCFLKHAGSIRKVDGIDYRIFNDMDLLAKIEYDEVINATN